VPLRQATDSSIVGVGPAIGLNATPLRSTWPTDSGTSETPKPPATTIFIDTGARSERVGDSKSADAIEQLLEEGGVGGDAGWGWWIDDEGAGRGEVADQDPDDIRRGS